MTFLSDKTLERLRGFEALDLDEARYKPHELISRGGMGAVYVADDERLSRRVALKILDSPDLRGELAQRLMQEARVLAQLEHPGIVPVHDVGTLPDGRVFYTMKLVEGLRLDEHIAKIASLPQRLQLFLRICDAVAFAHARGVLHRDLKPANIMVGSFGEVLVMDWGLAKILRDASERREKPVPTADSKRDLDSGETSPTIVTGHGTVLGTPGYMSPEQARGETDKVDTRSDVFSLGALLKFIAEGIRHGETRAPARSLMAICAKATADDPKARYTTVPELAADVSRHLEGLPVTAYSENLWERIGRFYRRYQVAILLIVAYLVMRVLALLFFREKS